MVPTSGKLIKTSGKLVPASGKLIQTSGKLVPASGKLYQHLANWYHCFGTIQCLHLLAKKMIINSLEILIFYKYLANYARE
jgi:hypothetical protein